MNSDYLTGARDDGQTRTQQSTRGIAQEGDASAGALTWPAPGARPINCDQVAWMLAAIGRYLPPSSHPAISRAREMQKFGLLYEIMESANLYFQDGNAQHNGTPPDVGRFQYASKQAEAEAYANKNRSWKISGASTFGPIQKDALK